MSHPRRRRRTRFLALALAVLAGSGQCNTCGQRFEDWNGGKCQACTNTGRT